MRKQMAFIRGRIVWKHAEGSTDRAKELFAGVLLGALIATLLFALGAAAAGFALLCRRDRARTLWFDIAGALTFVGVAVSILIEPDQMVRLCALSDQPD